MWLHAIPAAVAVQLTFPTLKRSGYRIPERFHLLCESLQGFKIQAVLFTHYQGGSRGLSSSTHTVAGVKLNRESMYLKVPRMWTQGHTVLYTVQGRGVDNLVMLNMMEK